MQVRRAATSKHMLVLTVMLSAQVSGRLALPCLVLAREDGWCLLMASGRGSRRAPYDNIHTSAGVSLRKLAAQMPSHYLEGGLGEGGAAELAHRCCSCSLVLRPALLGAASLSSTHRCGMRSA